MMIDPWKRNSENMEVLHKTNSSILWYDDGGFGTVGIAFFSPNKNLPDPAWSGRHGWLGLFFFNEAYRLYGCFELLHSVAIDDTITYLCKDIAIFS